MDFDGQYPIGTCSNKDDNKPFWKSSYQKTTQEYVDTLHKNYKGDKFTERLGVIRSIPFTAEDQKRVEAVHKLHQLKLNNKDKSKRWLLQNHPEGKKLKPVFQKATTYGRAWNLNANVGRKKGSGKAATSKKTSGKKTPGKKTPGKKRGRPAKVAADDDDVPLAVMARAQGKKIVQPIPEPIAKPIAARKKGSKKNQIVLLGMDAKNIIRKKRRSDGGKAKPAPKKSSTKSHVKAKAPVKAVKKHYDDDDSDSDDDDSDYSDSDPDFSDDDEMFGEDTVNDKE